MNRTAAISNPLVDAFLDALDARMNLLLSESNDVLPALVDSVSSELLYFLAEQFDALGYKGWKLATTDSEKRTLIKSAIDSAKTRGTLFGIRRALESVGFFTATISEHISATMSGFLQMNGATTMGSLTWAHFSVLVDLGEQAGVSVGLVSDLREMINTAKNERSLLVGIEYAATLQEDAIATESLLGGIGLGMSETIQTAYMNGLYAMNGAINMSSNADSLVVLLGLQGVSDTSTSSEIGTDLRLTYKNGTVINTTY